MKNPPPACDHSRGTGNYPALAAGHGTQAKSYEIAGFDDGPYPTREVRPSTASPDGNLSFATYAEAKRVLLMMIDADIAEAREWLLTLRYNRRNLRHTRKQEADHA